MTSNLLYQTTDDADFGLFSKMSIAQKTGRGVSFAMSYDPEFDGASDGIEFEVKFQAVASRARDIFHSGGNMKSTLNVLFLLAWICSYAHGQVRTEETRKTVDARGDTVVTTAEIISRSEDITPRSSILLVNPLKFFLFYNLGYFQRLSPSTSLGGSIQIPTPAGVDGWGINAEFRYHPSGKAPRGFYLAPNISYNNLHAGNSTAEPFSLGVMLGWQWFPGEEFAMGLGIGVDYYSGSASGENDNITKFSGSVPALRFDIGYAW